MRARLVWDAAQLSSERRPRDGDPDVRALQRLTDVQAATGSSTGRCRSISRKRGRNAGAIVATR